MSALLSEFGLSSQTQSFISSCSHSWGCIEEKVADMDPTEKLGTRVQKMCLLLTIPTEAELVGERWQGLEARDSVEVQQMFTLGGAKQH